MKEILEKYFQKFGDFSKEEINAVLEDLVVEKYPKGTVLLEQGQIPDKCYFVLEGCVREFGIEEDGREVTYEFYIEEYTIAIFSGGTMEPSQVNWVCMEDAILIVGDLAIEHAMYDKHDGLASMTRKIMEDNMGKMQMKNAMLIADSIEERYQKLEETRGDLLNRVPQHQIASYLGITPESLSRLKKRIQKSKMKIAK
jgi:CRP-like cAMP-binding protein